MDYKLVFTLKAEKDLEKLEKSIARMILKKLDEIVKSAEPLIFAKRLKNTKEEYWRFRIGDYRTIFLVDRETKTLAILVVLKVAHRREIYQDF